MKWCWCCCFNKPEPEDRQSAKPASSPHDHIRISFEDMKADPKEPSDRESPKAKVPSPTVEIPTSKDAEELNPGGRPRSVYIPPPAGVTQDDAIKPGGRKSVIISEFPEAVPSTIFTSIPGKQDSHPLDPNDVATLATVDAAKFGIV